jgi:hypothetical protein
MQRKGTACSRISQASGAMAVVARKFDSNIMAGMGQRSSESPEQVTLRM